MTFHSVCSLFFFFFPKKKTIQSLFRINWDCDSTWLRAIHILTHPTLSPYVPHQARKSRQSLEKTSTNQGRFAHDPCLFVYHNNIFHRFSFTSISFALYVHKITAHNGKCECVPWFSFCWMLLLYCKIDNIFSFRTYHTERLHKHIVRVVFVFSVSAYFIQQILIASSLANCIGFMANTIK